MGLKYYIIILMSISTTPNASSINSKRNSFLSQSQQSIDTIDDKNPKRRSSGKNMNKNSQNKNVNDKYLNKQVSDKIQSKSSINKNRTSLKKDALNPVTKSIFTKSITKNLKNQPNTSRKSKKSNIINNESPNTLAPFDLSLIS